MTSCSNNKNKSSDDDKLKEVDTLCLERNSFMNLSETIDADKLNYIVNNYESFKSKLRWVPTDDISINPMTLCKKYLARSRNGCVEVSYRQNSSKGRFCAIGSLSLQCIPREIRHTISQDFYVDLDMVNAHPVILSYLCKKSKFKHKRLSAYIKDREKYLKLIIDDNKCSRERAKKVYLSLTNGGIKDFNGLKKASIHMIKYKKEMIRLHNSFAELYPENFEKTKMKREKRGRDNNHKAAFMNTLLCDMENTILMCMYEFFGSPKNGVLCFDGIMLRKNEKYNLKKCEKYILKKLDIQVALKDKPMDEGFDLSQSALELSKVIEPYVTQSLEYYNDFESLVGKDVHEEWVREWSNNCLILVNNTGKQYYLAKKRGYHIYRDGTTEVFDEWISVKDIEVINNLKVVCNVINPKFDYDFQQEYMAMKPKERKKYIRKDVQERTERYKFTTLGNCSKKLGEGYLEHIMMFREIRSVNSVDFYPYLKSKGAPDLRGSFNLFTGFPLEDLDVDYGDMKFEDSKFWNHYKGDFCNENLEEWDQFLNHIADIIQDPAAIKGPSQLFYSGQGTGKGLLGLFMSRMVGVRNVVTISNTDNYFNNGFNVDVSSKLLKIFEEVSEKGKAFKNHNRLKAEQTMETERIEPKNIDPYHIKHCARYWYFSNNENSLYIENDDRRHTMHKIDNKHANDSDYFSPIWDEVKDPKFLKCAFDYLANKKYKLKDVLNAFITQYKQDQKESNLPNGLKFLMAYVQENFSKAEDLDKKIISSDLNGGYRAWCDEQGCKYHLATMQTQIKRVGIDRPRRLRIDGVRKWCYIINSNKLLTTMKSFLKNDLFSFDFDSNFNDDFDSNFDDDFDSNFDDDLFEE